MPLKSEYCHDNQEYVILYARGAVAQLGERLNGIQEVDGSIPFSSTINLLPLLFLFLRLIEALHLPYRCPSAKVCRL
jgi:hypothetical protein